MELEPGMNGLFHVIKSSLAHPAFFFLVGGVVKLFILFATQLLLPNTNCSLYFYDDDEGYQHALGAVMFHVLTYGNEHTN